jgi:signal transduction histidine kinase
MNPDLALIMLTNLVKNAIVHNIAGGFVNVIINADTLVVENSGANIPLDATKIFERFHTGNTGRGSVGLGLALVKAIADVSGFSVSYDFTGTHRITVKFSS